MKNVIFRFYLFKKNSIDFAHQSLFTGLREHHCICEKSCMKPFVAPEGAERTLIN